MLILRRFILFFIDFLLNTLCRARSLFALTLKDLKISEVDPQMSGYLPYDLVMLRKDVEHQQAVISTALVGVIVGYSSLDGNSIPRRAKVAFLNSAELSVPEVKELELKDLQVLTSPIRTLRIIAMLFQTEPLKETDDGSTVH